MAPEPAAHAGVAPDDLAVVVPHERAVAVRLEVAEHRAEADRLAGVAPRLRVLREQRPGLGAGVQREAVAHPAPLVREALASHPLLRVVDGALHAAVEEAQYLQERPQRHHDADLAGGENRRDDGAAEGEAGAGGGQRHAERGAELGADHDLGAAGGEHEGQDVARPQQVEGGAVDLLAPLRAAGTTPPRVGMLRRRSPSLGGGRLAAGSRPAA